MRFDVEFRNRRAFIFNYFLCAKLTNLLYPTRTSTCIVSTFRKNMSEEEFKSVMEAY